MADWVTCAPCKGTGEVWDAVWSKYFRCDDCKGLGKVKVK